MIASFVSFPIFFVNYISNQNNFASNMSFRVSDFQERMANLDNANKKYQQDHIAQDIEKFVDAIQNDLPLNDRNKLQDYKKYP